MQLQAAPAEFSPAVRKRPLRRMARIAVLAASAAFNRLVDMIGMGDSLLVELRIGNRP